MAIEQLSRGDAARDSGYQQELNFLSICESAKGNVTAARGSVETSGRAGETTLAKSQAEPELVCDELDFSVPVFP
ncbi:MAG TPA: hypothetical protein PKZ32_20940, partial [Candidatus Melainabacteria bacterium]|nr:hypothetical protein [Candidatus Melainabacteria bacterium]